MNSFEQGLNIVAVQFVPFMMAVVFHEYAHALAARRWGDRTAMDAGRLTLNPLPHVDPIGTLLFPLFNMISGIPILIGWARPVPIDPRRFTKYRPGLFWVSAAGPGMNFLLATVSAAAFCAMIAWVPDDFSLFIPLAEMMKASIFLNYALGIFNLLPLPPLDGSKMIESFLPFGAARKYEAFGRFSFFILLALLFTGALNVLSHPIRYLSEVTIGAMLYLFNIHPPTG